MARPRTNDEILDQLVYAVARVAFHYGPGLSPEGLKAVRLALAAEGPWWTDATWDVDVQDEPNPDFCPKVLPEDTHDGWIESFAEIAKMSRTGYGEATVVLGVPISETCSACGTVIGQKTHYQCSCGLRYCCTTTCPKCTGRTGDAAV